MEGIVGGIAGATIVGAHSPSQEIEQVYYLGAFDAREQLPPTIYRVTVRGQASLISGVKFGSGWVPARLIDSLNTHIGFDVNDASTVPTTTTGGDLVSLTKGRRMIMFGPEGFRESPRDHRLVIVMGTSPKAFFEAIDGSLKAISEVRIEKNNAELERLMFEARTRLETERKQLEELERDVAVELAEKGGAS